MKNMKIKEKNLFLEALNQVESTHDRAPNSDEDAEETHDLRSDMELVKTKVRATGSKNKIY